MSKTKLSKTLLYIILLLIVIIFFHFSASNNVLIEAIYSTKFYILALKPINIISSMFPFSLGELIVILLLVFLLYMIIKFYLLLINNKLTKSLLAKLLLQILKCIVIIYILFILLWGLNYNRLPFAKIAGLETKPATTKDLKKLCQHLIALANDMKLHANNYNNRKVSDTSYYRDVFNRAHLGYENISHKYPELKGNYSPPKPVFFSTALCYSGIAGIYFPFTGEANINIKIPDTMLPNTTCHEMAHQRGFAREDEANYIAYITCIAHPDYDFKYSGALLALIYSMNALHKYDIDSFYELINTYSDEVKQDLNFINSFWKKYEGPIEKASNKMNDAYLKANMQKDGTHSYGRMVDLLIAEYKAKDHAK